MGRAGNTAVAEVATPGVVRRRPRRRAEPLNLSFLHPEPHHTIRQRAQMLLEQAKSRNFTHVLPTLFAQRQHLSQAPLLLEIVDAACLTFLTDEGGEQLDGYARRLLTTAGAEPRSTAAIVREKRLGQSEPHLHLRSQASSRQTMCGRAIDPADGFHGHAPRGSFCDLPPRWTRCSDCAALATDDEQEPQRFAALTAAERAEVLAVARSAFIRVLSRRKVRPNPDSLKSLTMQIERDVRLHTAKKLKEIAARRLMGLSEAQRYARWFAPFDCEDFCADARDNEFIREAIRKHYGPLITDIPFPTLGDTLQALEETFVRLPETNARLTQIEKLFKADLIWRVWPETIDDLKGDLRTTSPMKQHWKRRWPEAFDGIEVRLREFELDL